MILLANCIVVFSNSKRTECNNVKIQPGDQTQEVKRKKQIRRTQIKGQVELIKNRFHLYNSPYFIKVYISDHTLIENDYF